MIKIVPYRIAFVSGEDDESPASDLLNPGPSSRGWATDKYCTYPQVNSLQDLFEFGRARAINAGDFLYILILFLNKKNFSITFLFRNWE